MLSRVQAYAGAVAVLVAGQVGCSVKSLMTTFNAGFLDSAGDPFHDPVQRRNEMVKELVTHELMDGYFTQGEAQGALGTGVSEWVKQAFDAPHEFTEVVYENVTANGGHLPWQPPPSKPAERSRKLFEDLADKWRSASPMQSKAASTAICESGKPTSGAAELSDRIRFQAAIQRAGDNVGALAIEGMVNEAEVTTGAKQAFAEIRQYLERRTWNRRFDRHVNGLVIKGGASSGLYSAGVVWVALNLIDRCLSDATCQAAAPDPRFALVSGTSTGAMVSIATELFNNAAPGDAATRKAALDHLAGWFTCVGASDLYCVQNGSAVNLLTTQQGMVAFDRIQDLLVDNVKCNMFANSSELVLNAVDFRTGTLFDLSDADELVSVNDVVQGTIASAVLPFIANPVQHLPVDYDPTHAIAQVYLDGGVRSELPILPLIRRGAERVLVVSSDASVTDDAYPLNDGLSIATRFIDVAVGGVTESEIQHAERHVESVRLAEISICEENEAVKAACAGAPSADCVHAFCEGDWGTVCSANAKGERAARPAKNALDLTDRRLESLWQERSFFRNETEVEGLHGYDFDSSQERRMFLAGAESARVRCVEIAELLGFPVEALGPRLIDWCAPVLQDAKPLCGGLGLTSSPGLRACGPAATPASTARCRR